MRTHFINLELTTNARHHKDHTDSYQSGFEQGYQDGKGLKIQELQARILELENRCESYY